MLEGQGHCWLTIYPHPSGSGLSPMLYWPQGEGGVHVLVLNERSIGLLHAITVSAETPGVLTTLYERLRSLLAESGTRLEREWARTAFDLFDNPVLVEQRRVDG